jgi:hypothetical protein
MPDAIGGWATVILPIVTLLIGYGTKSLSDWIQYKRSREQERDARDGARQALLFERRIIFQRETLLELQEDCQKLVRATGAMHHQDEMAYRETRQWQRQLFSEELDQAYHEASTRTSMLAVRVRDETVRSLVAELRSCSVNAGMAPNPETANQLIVSMISAHDALGHRIGEVLRNLDEAG